MNPNILGVIGPGFLNRVPTLLLYRAMETPKEAVLCFWMLQGVRVGQDL